MEPNFNFNIIRELYLNKENRDIINEFLKYINRKERSDFIYSMSHDICRYLFCDNCFKGSSGTRTKYSRCDRFGRWYFCEKCEEEHFDKYSKFAGIDKDTFDSCVQVCFYHECDIYKDLNVICEKHINSYRLLRGFVDFEKINTRPSIVSMFRKQ